MKRILTIVAAMSLLTIFLVPFAHAQELLKKPISASSDAAMESVFNRLEQSIYTGDTLINRPVVISAAIVLNKDVPILKDDKRGIVPFIISTASLDAKNSIRYKGSLNRKQEIFEIYRFIFTELSPENDPDINDEICENILKGKYTLHEKLWENRKYNCSQAGFVDTDDGLWPFYVIPSGGKLVVSLSYEGFNESNRLHVKSKAKSVYKDFFKNEIVRQQLLESQLDLNGTKIMIVEYITTFESFAVLFYDEKTELIMLMQDEEFKIKKELEGRWTHENGKVMAAYSKNTIYPVDDFLRDAIEYNRLYKGWLINMGQSVIML